MSGEAGQKLRADIQVLRAVAVCGVVLFHADVAAVAGGFHGVDSFFVISGFLITGLIVRELARSDTVDLLAFWNRRAWRLLPNALTVLAVCLVLSFALAPTAQVPGIAKDIAASLAYVANYWFAARAVDYFDAAVTSSPVLHFWSLSVEEQFYIVWPLSLLGLWCWLGRARGQRAVFAAAIVAISLAAAVIWAARSQPHAFFNTESRMWQLAAGGLLAILIDGRACNGALRWPILLLGCCGLAATMMIDPALAGIAPLALSVIAVVSTMAIIAAGATAYERKQPHPLVRPLLWLGDRSYSVYLWHWPVFTFAPMLAGSVMGNGVAAKAGMIVVTLLISELAFRWIERPLRAVGKTRTFATGAIAALSVSVVALALAAAALMMTNGGAGTTASVRAEILAAQADQPNLRRPDCPKGWALDPNNACLFGRRDVVRPRVVLFGDSYAEHLFPGLQAAAQSSGWSLVLLLHASCPTADGLHRNPQTGVADTECRDWRNAALQRIAAERPDLVIVSTAEHAARQMLDENTGASLSDTEAIARWQLGFRSLLQKLVASAGHVVVLPSTPRGRFTELDACLTPGSNDACGLARQKALDRSALTVSAAATVAGVKLVDLSDAFCGPNVCYSKRGGTFVYRDVGHHITASFAATLEPAFAAILDGATSRR